MDYYCNKGKYWKTLIQVLENWARHITFPGMIAPFASASAIMLLPILHFVRPPQIISKQISCQSVGWPACQSRRIPSECKCLCIFIKKMGKGDEEEQTYLSHYNKAPWSPVWLQCLPHSPPQQNLGIPWVSCLSTVFPSNQKPTTNRDMHPLVTKTLNPSCKPHAMRLTPVTIK
jgi:hypothetical protein